MTVAEIEAALARARRDVFSDDEQSAERAGDEIKRLLAALGAHPDEIERKGRVKAAQDEAFLRRWA